MLISKASNLIRGGNTSSAATENRRNIPTAKLKFRPAETGWPLGNYYNYNVDAYARGLRDMKYGEWPIDYTYNQGYLLARNKMNTFDATNQYYIANWPFYNNFNNGYDHYEMWLSYSEWQKNYRYDGLLRDLCGKYILSMSIQDRKDMFKVCNNIQAAYWSLYESNIGLFKSLRIKEFMKCIFYRVKFLNTEVQKVDSIYNQWHRYCRKIPRYGCALINGSFGKIEENESEVDCAAREVYEEVGYKCKEYINTNEYVEYFGKHNSRMKLFIIYGVDEKIYFKPKVKYEISDVQWHSISEICNKSDSKEYRLIYPSLQKLLLLNEKIKNNKKD
ncbi:hypothetical protein QYM36_014883 [Artemia franciscana]|uniref:Nudix hydrolase domain-containing protein n=1 Tax=Artemia franciscana TaxID=6661 RepID=A0AA88HJV8_ARTSF|nr:hypothetical protein QYM36_014883 [Artemia franciscana]